MSMLMNRWAWQGGVVILDALSVSAGFDVSFAAGGQFKAPAGVTSPLTWEARDSEGVWSEIQEAIETVSTAFIAGKWEAIPERILLSAGHVRVKAAAVVAGDHTIEFDLKA
ncbi:MAG: hypothetical protein DRH30_00950 [Deltaproteobacteria bacterium]|nr:MAG: hypothetical protein DRH30_00950 [Deltaproteobacteria bacterium]